MALVHGCCAVIDYRFCDFRGSVLGSWKAILYGWHTICRSGNEYEPLKNPGDGRVVSNIVVQYRTLARDQLKWTPVNRPITHQHMNDDHVYHFEMPHLKVIVI